MTGVDQMHQRLSRARSTFKKLASNAICLYSSRIQGGMIQLPARGQARSADGARSVPAAELFHHYLRRVIVGSCVESTGRHCEVSVRVHSAAS